MVIREIENKLKAPFKPEDIEWRIQQSGKQTVRGTGEVKHWALVLAYVTNRAIMDRLDEVFGIEGWCNEYKDAPEGGVLCGITAYIRELPLTKWDGAEQTNIEKVKGGLSNSMKRAAVQWGIGRYLYNLDTMFVTLTENKPADMRGYGVHYDKESKKRLYYKHPELPEFARPVSQSKTTS